jgi:hypothetical protein
VRFTTVLKALVGYEQAVPEEAWLEEEPQVIVVAVRPRSRARRRCGICRARCARFDAGAGRRRLPPMPPGQPELAAVVPGEALAEDTGFELVGGCPGHAFQGFVRESGRVCQRLDLLLSDPIHPCGSV